MLNENWVYRLDGTIGSVIGWIELRNNNDDEVDEVEGRKEGRNEGMDYVNYIITTNESNIFKKS